MPTDLLDRTKLETTLRLIMPQSNTSFDVTLTHALVIGRSDHQQMVDVDLTNFGAYVNGLSRRHVEITQSRDGIHVRDLASRNGTTLNGRMLNAQTSYPLKDGDVLRLSDLELRVRILC